MRGWFARRQKLIIWTVAIVFAVGIIWWSVAGFIARGRTSPVVQSTSLSPEDAFAYLTKDGTPMAQEYWIFDGEVESSMGDLLDYYRSMGAQFDELFDYPVVRASVVNDLLHQRLIRYYAEKNDLIPSKEDVEKALEDRVNKYLSDEKAKSFIESRYGSIENFKNKLRPNVEMSIILDKVKEKLGSVDEDEVKEYFEKNKSEIQKEYERIKARHILLSNEASALEIKRMIEEGELSFEKAASEFSLDDYTRSSGGELGWFGRGKMVKEFEAAAFNATPNVLVGPVKTPFGYHLIEVEDKLVFQNFAQLKEATSVYAEIKTKLENEKFKKALEEFKKSEKIEFVINDEVTRFYYDYATGKDEKEREKILDTLSSSIFTGTATETVVATSVDDRLLALYVSAVEEKLEGLNEVKSEYDRIINLSERVKKELLEDATPILKEKADEYLEMAREATKDELIEKYVDAYLDYYDAYTYKNLMAKHADMSLEDINEKARELGDEMERLKNREKKVLHVLYEHVPNSSRVVSKLYNLEPDNANVRFDFYRLKYESIKNYVKDPKIYKAYSQYLQPEVYNIFVGLEGLLGTSDVSTDLKISALEILAELSEYTGQCDSQIHYLKKIKELAPDYEGIDELIEHAETLKASATEAATEGTAEASPTPMATQ
ncbi:MAG: peptidylprolyl isomerase [Thermotogae bacterium]|nr:peptidylprolyl isomerase [Thermotogota bacterium]